MILQVHDELLFEIKPGLIEKALPIIIKLMEGVVNLKVPIIAEAKVGNNWSELEKYA